MHELDQPPDEPIEGGAADGTRGDQDRERKVAALPPERPPVIEPVGSGANSEVHDSGTGDGWVPA